VTNASVIHFLRKAGRSLGGILFKASSTFCWSRIAVIFLDNLSPGMINGPSTLNEVKVAGLPLGFLVTIVFILYIYDSQVSTVIYVLNDK
jgi:hypothetical protein